MRDLVELVLAFLLFYALVCGVSVNGTHYKISCTDKDGVTFTKQSSDAVHP
jgi:hypothetical protein